MLTNIQVFTCDYCGVTETMRVDGLYPDSVISRSTRPCSWKWIGDKLACPSHDVKVVKKPPEKESP